MQSVRRSLGEWSVVYLLIVLGINVAEQNPIITWEQSNGRIADVCTTAAV